MNGKAIFKADGPIDKIVHVQLSILSERLNSLLKQQVTDGKLICDDTAKLAADIIALIEITGKTVVLFNLE